MNWLANSQPASFLTVCFLSIFSCLASHQNHPSAVQVVDIVCRSVRIVSGPVRVTPFLVVKGEFLESSVGLHVRRERLIPGQFFLANGLPRVRHGLFEVRLDEIKQTEKKAKQESVGRGQQENNKLGWVINEKQQNKTENSLVKKQRIQNECRSRGQF